MTEATAPDVQELLADRDLEVLREKIDLVQVSTLKPCPENDIVYGAQSIDDPDIRDLIADIRENGVTDPLHISADNYIISGHRRRFCAIQAGVRMAPVIRNDISYKDDRATFLKLLRTANLQRKKSPAMLMREATMAVDPNAAVAEMQAQRKAAREERLYGDMSARLMESSDIAQRSKISEASMPFLQAARDILNANRDFWPLSVRQVHYRLLNDPPLRFTAKTKAAMKNAEKRRYRNDESSYKSLLNLLARARIEGSLSWEAIDDETRPEELNNHPRNVEHFAKWQADKFMRGYQRNRMQSQSVDIEIVAEKLTVRSILSSIADEHSIPLTITRGHNDPTVKRKIAQRFWRSKKESMVVLVVSDLDPAGEAIVQNMYDDLIDDHRIYPSQLQVYRAGLTMERVDELDLTPSYDTDEKDITTKAAYEAKYGTTDAWELEAMEPADLQRTLVEDIDQVIDIEAYNAELELERTDAVEIAAKRAAVIEFLRTA